MEIRTQPGTDCHALTCRILSSVGTMYDITRFGILPGNSPTANSANLQMLEDFVYALGGGVLSVPPGVYPFATGSNGYAIRKRPRVSYVGEDRALSVFKLADQQGNYKSFFWNDGSESVDDVRFERLMMDQNKLNNPVTYPNEAAWIADIQPRMALWLLKAQRLTIRDCHFTMMD